MSAIKSVNTKDGIRWGAVKETALYVRHHLAEVNQAFGEDADAAYKHLLQHHAGVWSDRAEAGTRVHAVNEAWIAGESGVVEPGDEGYVDGLEKFWRDCRPETVAVEEIVRHPTVGEDYIGTRDWVATLHGVDGEHWQLDLKTTAEQRPDKGFYFEEWSWQHAAYRHCEEIVEYDGRNEAGTRPNDYPVTRCGVVHLRGDGNYQLWEVAADADALAAFLHLRAVWQWLRDYAKKSPPVMVRPELLVSKGAA